MRSLMHAPRSRRRSIAAATLGALALIGSLLVATPAPVAQKLRKDVGATSESLNYPASAFGVYGPTYWNSVSAGQSNLIAEMNSVAKSCSSTKMWVGGHSQGAQVVEDVLASGKLSNAAKANFRGAVLAGNPTYIPNEAVDAPGNGLEGGILAPWHHSIKYLSRKNNKGKKVTLGRSYCYFSDFYCQASGQSLGVHNSYGKEPTPTNEEKWLRQFS